jgi:hypothetical protein
LGKDPEIPTFKKYLNVVKYLQRNSILNKIL